MPSALWYGGSKKPKKAMKENVPDGHTFFVSRQTPVDEAGKATFSFACYASAEAFYDKCWSKTPLAERCYFELVRDGRPCIPYFDVEWEDGDGVAGTEEEVLGALKGCLTASFRAHFGVELDDACFVVCCSSAGPKHSFHVMIRKVDGGSLAVFANNQDAKCWTDTMRASVGATEWASGLRRPAKRDKKTGEWKPRSDLWVIDFGVYQSDQPFRMFGCTKWGQDRHFVAYGELREWFEYLATWTSGDTFTLNVDALRPQTRVSGQPRSVGQANPTEHPAEPRVTELLGRYFGGGVHMTNVFSTKPLRFAYSHSARSHGQDCLISGAPHDNPGFWVEIAQSGEVLYCCRSMHAPCLGARALVGWMREPPTLESPCEDIRIVPLSDGWIGDAPEMQAAAQAVLTTLGSTCLVKASVGAGKTTWLNEGLLAHPDAQRAVPRVLIVGSRRALAHQQFRQLGELGFVLYLDASVSGEKRGIVLLDSILSVLSRGQQLPKYDLVIVDELESLLAQCDAATLRANRKSHICFKLLYELVRRTTHFIGLDADLGPRSLDFIRRHRGSATVYVSPKRPQKCTFHVLPRKDDVVRELLRVLRDGKRAVLVVNSRKDGRAAVQSVLDRLPHLLEHTLLLDGLSDGKLKRVAAADANEFWAKFSLVVFSPTIGCGTDFSLPDHFHYIFGIGINSSYSNTAREFAQQLGRVRYPVECEGYLYLDSECHKHTVSLDALRAMAYRADGVNRRFSSLVQAEVDGDQLTLAAVDEDELANNLYNQQERNMSLSGFRTDVLQRLKARGHAIVFRDCNADEAVDLDEESEEYQRHFAMQVAAAADLTPDEADELKRLRENDIGTADDDVRLRKFFLQRRFPGAAITPEFVLEFGTDQFRGWLDNYRALLACQHDLKWEVQRWHRRYADAGRRLPESPQLLLEALYLQRPPHMLACLTATLLAIAGFEGIGSTEFVPLSAMPSIDEPKTREFLDDWTPAVLSMFGFPLSGKTDTHAKLLRLLDRVLKRGYGIKLDVAQPGPRGGRVSGRRINAESRDAVARWCTEMDLLPVEFEVPLPPENVMSEFDKHMSAIAAAVPDPPPRKCNPVPKASTPDLNPWTVRQPGPGPAPDLRRELLDAGHVADQLWEESVSGERKRKASDAADEVPSAKRIRRDGTEREGMAVCSEELPACLG